MARTGRSRAPEPAGHQGESRPADPRSGPRRAPEIAGPLSRPADRAPHRGRCNFPDAVRSSDPSRNRYSHSAIRARTLRAAVERFRAREEPPAAPRHKAKTPPPQAELVRQGNGRNPKFNGRRQPSRGGTSGMTRECHVRICEGSG